MGMPVQQAQIAFVVIMGNHVVSHNQQPAENDKRGFDVNPGPQIIEFSANVVIFKCLRKI